MLATTKIMSKKPCLKFFDSFFFFFPRDFFLGKTISWINWICLKLCWRRSTYFIYQLSKCILRHSDETFSSRTLCIWFDMVHMKQFLHLKIFAFLFPQTFLLINPISLSCEQLIFCHLPSCCRVYCLFSSFFEAVNTGYRE